MFKDFVDLCFAGLETGEEKLFVMVLVVLLIRMMTEIFVAVVEVSKRC